MSDVDRGYFPKGESVLRMVMEERLVGTLYGSRALVVGALEPMAFTGTYLRSRATRSGDYYGRLLDTQAAFEDVFFETRAEADKTLRRVARMHAGVSGQVNEGIGPDYPEGSTYSAGDPWLAFWTMAVLCESAYAIYRAYVRDLTEEEKALYWADWRRFGEMFGMPADAAPETWQEFRQKYLGYIHSDRPHVLQMANRAAIAVVNLPGGAPVSPARRVMYLLMVGTLPDRVRKLHGLSWGTAEQLAWVPVREAARVGGHVIPAPVRQGPVGGRARRILDPLRDREVELIRDLQSRLPMPT
ncbi:MAG: DUF2236 domain-containing protein [Actinomycetia bacterium]|nr:DUF2236 domain-containing protein [Actinomycetes bacterium]